MPCTDAQLQQFLSLLAFWTPGNVVLANMAAARTAGHWTGPQSRQLLDECCQLCTAQPHATPQHAYEALAQVIAARHQSVFFTRALTEGLDSPIALVVTHSLLFPPPVDLDVWERQNRLIFTRAYIEAVRAEGGAVDPANRPEQAMADILEGFAEHLHPNAQLGRDHYVVFVTRADAAWEHHLASVPLDGDELRDRLGLPYPSGSLLVSLRSRSSLAVVAGNDVKVAAPTALEAWRCDFFRQIPDQPDSFGWGQTIHFRLLSTHQKFIDGAPEAVIQVLPIAQLRQDLVVQPAGLIGQPPQATVQMHLQRLLQGRTISAIIDAVLAP